MTDENAPTARGVLSAVDVIQRSPMRDVLRAIDTIHRDRDVEASLADLVKSQPMRRLVTMVCDPCKHEWVQPAAQGCCPRCHRKARGVDVRVSALRIL